MKKFTLLSLILLSFSPLFGQNSNAVFFAPNGEQFYVILNGLRQNETPQTNVKVTGLNEAPYTVRVIFADQALGGFDKKIYLYNNTESTYKVIRKSESGTSKEFKKFGNKLARNFSEKEDPSEAEVFTDRSDWWAMKLQSQVDLISAQPVQRVAQQPAPQAQPAASAYSSQTTTTTTTTGTTTTGTAGAGGESVSVNLSINANGGGGSVNMNAQGGGTGVYTEETTVTTTTTTTGGGVAAVPAQDHYVMPGYNGAIGCNWPMSDGDFASAKNSIRSKDFEDSKLTIAKQVISTNCLFASQVREVMLMFDFEDTKLQFAKYAYDYTYDLNNYYKVNDAFDFETTIDQLNRYIQAQ